MDRDIKEEAKTSPALEAKMSSATLAGIERLELASDEG
ncbi:hypothetical protein L195_g063153 [Trifolium pratense]|uniref:Uncharacterized protein n=1 Tax=Trifolium pratense TaxID=57577 RepID=A0A2K3KK80_TRIPR|nr:hypothetical protein L195_g063153 [Trifolium pratense]